MLESFSKTSLIVEKALKGLDDPKLLDSLQSAKGEVLQALLMHVFENRVKNMTPKDILRQAKESRFVAPSPVSQRDLVEFDNIAFNILSKDTKDLELSPVGPLGTTSILSKISQKNIVATSRNNEVVSDASLLLAIEYEKRRKSNFVGEQHFFTSQRILRAQKFDIEGFTPHFKALFMLSADKFLGRWEIISNFLERHIEYYLSLIRELIKFSKYEIQDIKVSISNLIILEKIIKYFKLDRNIIMRNTQTRNFNLFKGNNIDLPSNVDSISDLKEIDLEKLDIKRACDFMFRNTKDIIDRLKLKFPEIHFDYDLSRVAGIGYYDHLCIKIAAKNSKGELYPLCDGGFTDWTRQLLHSEKEICFTSGFGSELFINKFKK